MIEPRQLLRSFRHAVHGVKIAFKAEQSFRVQAIAALLVVLLMLVLPVNAFEVIILFLVIASVLILELINSIFERLVDAFKPRIHPVVGEIKDIMAATVLIASVFATCIGLIIFVPKLLALVS